MKPRAFVNVLCAAALLAGPAVAGSVLARPPAGGRAGLDTTALSNSAVRVVTGTVKEYQADKWLAVQTNDNQWERFKLDDKDVKVDVDPSVKVGSKVKVTERVENGARTLIVETTLQS